MSMTRSLAILAAGLLAVGHAAAGEITRCDELATHPADPHKVTRGVQTSEVDLPAAIAACKADVDAQPDNARLRYQLARVLFYSDQYDPAMQQMRLAADGGHAQAQFVYGIFVIKQRPGAPADRCVAERYWSMAARGGRHAAPVNYAVYKTRGDFDDCRSDVTAADLAGWLAAVRDAAAPGYDGYYQRLLIDDLLYRLEAAAR